MIVLVELFWSRYYAIIFFCGLIPFFIYFVLVLVYTSRFVTFSEDSYEESSSTQLVMRLSIMLFVIYFVSFDVVCMLRDGKRYLKDIFNWVDILSCLINVFLVIETNGTKFDNEHI